jgi:uncharacterized repeat protein (TIGR01451 family)
MLLSNWDRASGLTRDRANFPAGKSDNVSASGMQAAAAVMAWRLGFISRASATEIVTRTTEGLLDLPHCGGLWPHFVTNGQIATDTEWSSVDTILAVVPLLEAREALGLESTAVEQMLTDIDWAALILPDGSISHGYNYTCTERLENGWHDFGTETWLANYGYAAATGNVTGFNHTPPTYNGSGFIDELAWLLVPPPCLDGWGTEWRAYSQQAANRQINYYQDSSCYDGPPRLFGLSAAEIPDPSAVTYPHTQTYQTFGVGGTISATDGITLLGHAVIVPHYAAMIASLHPDEASAFWGWIETKTLFTPLNDVESFMFDDDKPTPTCQQVVWNDLKGSWNLSLQTLGWGRLLAGSDNPLYQGMRANDMLKRGYLSMRPSFCDVAERASPSPVKDGALLTYTIRITNTSDVTLTFIVTDSLPSHVTPTGVLTWMPTITAPGGVWTEPVVVTVEAGFTGQLTNKVRVATESCDGGTASVTICANRCILHLPIILKNSRP